jgi:hypothetical protein
MAPHREAERPAVSALHDLGGRTGGTVDPPLQVTDRPRAQARRLGQLLMGQPGLGPQLPQQPGERKRRLLRHDPTPLAALRRGYPAGKANDYSHGHHSRYDKAHNPQTSLYQSYGPSVGAHWVPCP